MIPLSQSSAIYIFILIYVIGELIPYVSVQRDRVIALTSSGRPFVGLLIAVHCIASILSYEVHFLSILANASYISALFMMFLEFIRSDKDLRLSAKKSATVFGITFIICFIFNALKHGGAGYAALIILLALLAQSAVLFSATRKAIMLKFSSIYIGQAVFAATIGWIVIIARLYLVESNGIYSVNLQSEAEYLSLLRLINAASFFLLLNAITNYHSQTIIETEEAHRLAAQSGTLKALITLAKTRANKTENHFVRVREFIRLVARRLDQKRWFGSGASDEMIKTISDASALSDIGKVGIPESILQNPKKLSAADWETMKSHPLIGAAMIEAAMEGQDNSSVAIFKVARDIVVGVNENWDGSGYPRGLEGDAIPRFARVAQIAILYDEMTSPTLGQMRLGHEEAVEEIKKLAGTKLDPEVVAAFLDRQHWLLDVAIRHRDV